VSDWISNIISGVALGLSACSLYIARRADRRAADVTKITAWIELRSTRDKEWHLATVHIKNPSRNNIKGSKDIG
jgi:hypothetical protein